MTVSFCGVVLTKFEGMRLELNSGSMGFHFGVYKTLGSPSTTVSFCGVVFLKSVSIVFRIDHLVSHSLASGLFGEDYVVFKSFVVRCRWGGV
ncbi:hypothetical protein P8452_73223 [Trifolium repens]|nr:hypothetical protein QL285_048101 [Trifolium repens]WJX91444.1 hypothetical protein P8452_73223 [Trifolium repens]